MAQHLLKALDCTVGHRGNQLSRLGAAVRDALLSSKRNSHDSSEMVPGLPIIEHADSEGLHDEGTGSGQKNSNSTDHAKGDKDESQEEFEDREGEFEESEEDCGTSEECEESEECEASEEDIYDSEGSEEGASTAIAATVTAAATATSVVAVRAPCHEHVLHPEAAPDTSAAKSALATASLEAAFLELEGWLLQHSDASHDEFAEVATEKLEDFFREAGPYRSNTLSWEDYNADFRGVHGCVLWDRACRLFRHGTRDPRSCPDGFLHIIARLQEIWTRHFRVRRGAT
jgi:hypothetical protein